LQAGIIALLLVERRRRHVAQAEASNRRQEVVRLNRVTTANVLSSSIAHELNQPLRAILSNTEAAQMLLKADPPDLLSLAYWRGSGARPGAGAWIPSEAPGITVIARLPSGHAGDPRHRFREGRC
jgi:signal transduction histidine kinase